MTKRKKKNYCRLKFPPNSTKLSEEEKPMKKSKSVRKHLLMSLPPRLAVARKAQHKFLRENARSRTAGLLNSFRFKFKKKKATLKKTVPL